MLFAVLSTVGAYFAKGADLVISALILFGGAVENAVLSKSTSTSVLPLRCDLGTRFAGEGRYSAGIRFFVAVLVFV